MIAEYYSANQALIEFDEKVDPRVVLMDSRRRSFGTVEMGIRNISVIFDTWLYSLFSLPPKEGGHHKQILFDVLYQEYFDTLYHECSSTQKNSEIPKNYAQGTY